MDTLALEGLYLECAQGAWRHAAALVHDEALAWDVVHEVFARLCEAACLPEAPVAYLHRAITHAGLNQLRARRRHGETALCEADEPPTADSGEAALGAREVLTHLDATLDAPDRRILALLLADGLTQAEAARVLHISRRTLSRHLAHIEAQARHLEGTTGRPPRE